MPTLTLNPRREAALSSLARGYINPRSPISVRLLTRRKEAIDEGFFRRRLEEALALRRRMVAETTAFRLVHSEGGGPPGLLVDRWGAVLVLQTLTLGMARHEPRIVRLLQELLQAAAVYGRNAAPVRQLEGLPL